MCRIDLSFPDARVEYKWPERTADEEQNKRISEIMVDALKQVIAIHKRTTTPQPE
ncbi:MAG: hypothetical protein K2R93_12230 [Gemmatimonadaceae bacterium]|nr:hypothetical protein [Gemmatimonadaceae bacterium]